MNTTDQRERGTPVATLVVVVLGGVLALFGTYWDEAWHTDVGRDEVFSPPHLALYAGTGGVLGGIAWWAWVALRSTSLADLVGDRPLTLALVGAAAAAASAPIDVAWHAAFGRDAVLWSPPHMLGIAGFIAVAAGILAALRRWELPHRRLLASVATALLLAVCLVPVIEYEGDVPQFAEVWYLPVATAGIVLAFAVADRVHSWTWLATTAAGIYTGVRLVFGGTLVALDHSAQLIPPVLVAGLVHDLTRGRGPLVRGAALAAAISASYPPVVNHVYAGVRLRLVDVAIGIPLMIGISAATLAPQRPHRIRVASVATPLALVALLGLAAAPAIAHDPGQGEPVLPVSFEANTTDEHVHVTAVVTHEECDDLEPVRTVARRAGVTTTGTLSRHDACTFRGRVVLPGPSRWFVYAEIEHDGVLLEGWLPVRRPDPGHEPTSASKRDWMYVPAGTGEFSATQWVAGALLYLVILGLLAGSILVTREPVGRAGDR